MADSALDRGSATGTGIGAGNAAPATWPGWSIVPWRTARGRRGARRAWTATASPRPRAPEQTLALLDELVSPATMAWPGRAFSASSSVARCRPRWRPTGSRPPGIRTRPSTTTPGVARLEQIALRWLLDLLELPRESGRRVRDRRDRRQFRRWPRRDTRVLARAGWNVEADGLFGAPPITVVVGEEAHPSLIKSLGMLGLGRSRVVRVPVDGQGRMRAEALPAIRGPDDHLPAGRQREHRRLRSVARWFGGRTAQGAWLHVDGAFGLWAKAAPRLRALVEGVECADSWATDAHKWLNVPYDSGVAFVRDAARAVSGHGRHGRISAAAESPSAIRATTRRSCRGARAASKCGRRCAASVAMASPR